MDHVLRDANSRIVGKIKTLSNGRLEGRDANSRLKGTYDPKSNETRDSNGHLIGKGNLLAAIVTSSLFT
jgi:hypothetical protein